MLYVILRKQKPTGPKHIYSKTKDGCPDGMIASPFMCCQAMTPGCIRCNKRMQETPYHCREGRPTYIPKPVYNSEGNIIGQTRDGYAQPLIKTMI